MKNSKTVKKPWGKEIIWAEAAAYVGKFLHINPGHRLSLQYHEKKEETIFVQEGTLLIWTSEDERNYIVATEGSTYHVEPKSIHRFGAPAEQKCPTVLVEVSTNYLDDVVRLSDDYSRSHN